MALTKHQVTADALNRLIIAIDRAGVRGKVNEYAFPTGERKMGAVDYAEKVIG